MWIEAWRGNVIIKKIKKRSITHSSSCTIYYLCNYDKQLKT